jgi:hypothetical protein
MPDALKRIDELERADSQAAICKAPSPADSATAANRLKHARETLLFDLKARHEEAWLIERFPEYAVARVMGRSRSAAPGGLRRLTAERSRSG